MTTALDWARDGPTWPHVGTSRHVAAGGLTWHVQIFGSGPPLLMLHGTGASSHSWRHLTPLLAAHFTTIVPDLPGHAFTSAPPANGLTLPAMARATAALLDALALWPAVAIGHSAGAAVALAMIRDGLIAPAGMIGINAALLPFGGIAGVVFQPMARLLTFNAALAGLLADNATPRRVADTLSGTGSTLDAAGLAYYERLFRSPRHVRSALQMMAGWDLAPLVRAMPNIKTPIALVVAGGDRAIAPEQAGRVADLLPAAEVIYLKSFGHLVHEEAPDLVAGKILEIVRRWIPRP